ncbi:hypothetical protein DLAC_09271 [Tieghemostelium lacteum]|uniref:PiggyBac transposable element-derived protein domain-containing protein n=1 Tax=Tieghemostelium lacteum TaxID=361077 RepID=A0A151Z9M6_TIELA|nr:hypothetical protein DLAC_09271 [Tieghemostelium lacteum]|eukprot:KYQ90639.1 hypothetical protein DLAC_09271 [Tieghemostelium lacteum]
MLVFSLDDDLYKWTSRGDTKKHLPDGIGNILWKLADENKYIYHIEIENYVRINLKHNEDLNRVILQKVEQSVPRGPYCFVIDAGLLGSTENAQYLLSKNRFFIVSVGANRIKNTLDNVLDNPNSKKVDVRLSKGIGTIKCGIKKGTTQASSVAAIAWKPKQDKIVYFYTNISQPLFRIDKYPRIASVYNYTHNYVDVSKMIVNRHRNIHRARIYWRSVFNDILNVLLYNSFILYSLKSKSNGTSPLSYKKYILSIFKSVFNTQTQNQNNFTRSTLIIPLLTKSSAPEKKTCEYKICNTVGNKISNKPTIVCSCHNFYFHPICSIAFHNEHLSIKTISQKDFNNVEHYTDHCGNQ